MVSVCMAVKNGERFVAEQIQSILIQLGAGDELIISDDSSSDGTCTIIRSFSDKRIQLVANPSSGLVSNFENALRLAQGNHVFLSDQDDIWRPNKIDRMKCYLDQYGLVVCDCEVKGIQGSPVSYFSLLKSGKGLMKNLIKNSYMGCCMAFGRSLLEKALPFPQHLRIHDQWIGLVAEVHSNVFFLEERLVQHRRHDSNASTTFGASTYSLSEKFKMRYHLAKNLMRLAYA